MNNSVYNFKSSANILILVLLEKKSAISFINKLNKSGPLTLPWGTPHHMHEILLELTRTDWVRFNKNALIQNNKFPEIPKLMDRRVPVNIYSFIK